MTIASLNARFLTLTSYKSDLEFRINQLMSKRQYLAYKSLNIADSKASAFLDQDENKLGQIESIEDQLQAMDKILEMEEKNLETQQKAASTEMESVKKLLDKNIQSEFKAFA